MGELQQGIAALKAGDKETARALLNSVVRHEPNNERAWGILYSVVTGNQEKIDCLNQILRINPDNQKAKEFLGELTRISPSGDKNNFPSDDSSEAQKEISASDDLILKMYREISKNKIQRSVNLFFSSLMLGNLVAIWWISSYITQTVIGKDPPIALWDYVNGKEYGLGLGAAELIFVVIIRYVMGCGLSSGVFYFLGQSINFLSDQTASILEKNSRAK